MSTELKNIVNHIVYDRQEEAKAEFTKYIEAKVKERMSQSPAFATDDINDDINDDSDD